MDLELLYILILSAKNKLNTFNPVGTQITNSTKYDIHKKLLELVHEENEELQSIGIRIVPVINELNRDIGTVNISITVQECWR